MKQLLDDSLSLQSIAEDYRGKASFTKQKKQKKGLAADELKWTHGAH